MVWPDRWKSVLVISLVSLLLYPAVARADTPTSYISEFVNAYYNADGSLASPIEGYGYMEVEVPNTQDVLQYLVLKLSGTANTNLQSTSAYRGVAASPSPGDRTRLYVNTTAGGSSISYGITNPGILPVIYLKLDYSNDAGGRDIHSGGDNQFSFNLTINSSQDLGGVSVTLRFARNTLGINDSVNIYGVTTTSGNSDSWDSDYDGFFDMVSWTGDLSAGVDVFVSFKGEITPGVNFDENIMYVDLDQGTTSQGTYSSSGTFSGISFIDRFSRGPVREGVEMLTMGTWAVRGFIRNMATGLDYRIHGWNLSQIGQVSPVLTSTGEVYPFGPGETEYTDWYDTGVSGMQDKLGYYAVSWDWEVDWGVSQYSGNSQSTITLPVLYEIDIWVDKSVVLNYNTQSGTGLSVQDLARHMGYSGLSVNSLDISSVLPHQSSGGATNIWVPSGIKVLYINASGQRDITSQVGIAAQAATESSDGSVNVSIPDVGAVLGRGLRQNEDIRLEYTVSGNSHSGTQTYQFCQGSTLVTASGTPVTDTACQDVVIPGVGAPPEEPGRPGAGPGAAPAPALHAEIVKEIGEAYFLADNLVRVLARYDIVDTGDKGVKDIRALIYVPEYSEMDPSSLSFRIYDSSTGWAEWRKGTEYEVNDNGMTVLEGRKYREYVISKIVSGGAFEEGLTLFDGDKIEVSYITTIPVGTTFLLTRASGYNYYEDKYIFEDLYIPVRREGVLQDLAVEEDEWQLDKVYAGVPPRWTKSIDVYNPNRVPVEQAISFGVFGDTISAHLIREGGSGKESLTLKEGDRTYVDIIVRLGADEKKSYVLEAVTPPVLETQREVDVLESSEREIKFMLNATLENFALEGYANVSFLFNSDADNIISAMGDGIPLYYDRYDDFTTEIFIGGLGPGEKRRLTLIYTEVPPILVTAMSSVMYGCNDYANMTVFVIPSEKESGSYLEIEVVGPEPQLKTTNAQLVEMRDMWPWEEVRVPLCVDLRSFHDGRYFVHTKFKKDFQTILSDQSDFFVNCPERIIVSVSWLGFLGLAIVVIAYLVFRFLKKRGETGMDALRKRLRELG
jgi:hypothetical protein